MPNSNEIFVKPGPGLLVRKPDGSRLAEDGELVPRTAYWLRRLKDGDAVQANAPKKINAKKGE
ncbi:MAG: DUF2635 domain-containing protein [Desulfobulbaceae bacterium]|nr:DUF2635 domain-containing protein [Desulfobulbaceae bacterium]